MVTRRQIKDALSLSNRKPEQEVRSIDWDTVHSACRLLADYIKTDPIIRHRALEGGIIAVARGGLIPATIISHMLELPIAYVLHPPFIDNMPNDGEYIIIDDICDTGKTFSYLQSLIPRASRVALLHKPEGKKLCDASTMEVPQNIWIKFPWEQI